MFLLMHLRMTGTLLLDPRDDPPYERVRFVLDAGAHELRFCDPRRFGTGELAAGPPGARRLLRRAPGARAAVATR